MTPERPAVKPCQVCAEINDGGRCIRCVESALERAEQERDAALKRAVKAEAEVARLESWTRLSDAHGAICHACNKPPLGCGEVVLARLDLANAVAMRAALVELANITDEHFVDSPPVEDVVMRCRDLGRRLRGANP